MLTKDFNIMHLCHKNYRQKVSSNDENADYDVDVEIVLSIVLFAIYRSDRAFGLSQTVTNPVTAEEALDAASHLNNMF